MSQLSEAVAATLQQWGYLVERRAEPGLLTFRWERSGGQFPVVVTVAPVGEAGTQVVIVRVVVPLRIDRDHLFPVLDAVNRINAGYPFANLMVDTVSGSNALLTEAHLFVVDHGLEAALLREVLELSLELAEFALPAFRAIVEEHQAPEEALRRLVSAAPAAGSEPPVP